MGFGVRALLVEDSEDDAELLLRELRRAGYDPSVSRVDTDETLREALAQATWDVVIADYALPNFSATAALTIVQDLGLDLPFIVVSGKVGEDTAVEAMKAGAHDFILKSNLSRLAPAIAREVHDAGERHTRRAAQRALREREGRFRSLIEHASDLIAVLAPDGTITYTSPSVERVLGYAANAVVGHPITAFVHSDDVSRVQALVSDLIPRPNTPTPLAFRFRHREGTWRVLEAVATNLLADPDVQGIVANARDITERHRAEDNLQGQLARLAALRTIDMAITGSLDLRVTFNVFLDQVTAQLHVDAADVLLFDRYTLMLAYAAGRGFRANRMAGMQVRLGEGLAGQAALARDLLHIPDLQLVTQNHNPSYTANEGFVAYYGVPLISKGQIQGVMELFHRGPMEVDPDWLEFLETLAGQAAIAIDNAGLFDELQRSNIELSLAYDTTLEGWTHALDLRDQETEGHTQRVTEWTLRLARLMGLGQGDLVHLRRGALLHDIGKMGIPDRILLKPGPLTEEEWAIMRRHPVYAYEMLSPIAFLRPALDVPYCHHERWDGTGYPRGLKGEQIPFMARIFSTVDVWDALRSNRPYRAAWPIEQVRAYIRSLAGIHFDPQVVQAFLELEQAHPGLEGEFTR